MVLEIWSKVIYIIVDFIIILPTQDCVFVSLLKHGLLPVYPLVWDWIPVPHVAEHEPKAPQAVQDPSTDNNFYFFFNYRWVKRLFHLTHFDSFQFHLQFQYTANFHWRAWTLFWCWYYRFQNMHPNCPMLSTLPQLKPKRSRCSSWCIPLFKLAVSYFGSFLFGLMYQYMVYFHYIA